MNYRSEISKEEIISLPLGKYNGNIVLINKYEDAILALEKIKACKVIGIDTEARPAFRRGQSFPVSLLQIATDLEVYLFRLLKTGHLPMLMDILENKHITKVGIAIHDDLKDLSKTMTHKAHNIVDLNQFAQSKGFKSIGARKLSAIVLDIRISKAQQVSNWENAVLSPAQINYAATDAWLCREIYLKLLS